MMGEARAAAAVDFALVGAGWFGSRSAIGTGENVMGFRERCLSGARIVGPFVAIPHPVAVEVVAAQMPDMLCLDGEHGQIGRGAYEDLIRAADVHGAPAMVRVPGHAPEAIAGVLDAGAVGVLVPRVSTAAEARAIVQATRYPPQGARGVGPGRASGYGYRVAETLAVANERVVLAIQVETAEGLANIDAIVAVEGVDVIFVGPGDLSVSMAAMGPEGAPRLEAAIERIAQATRAAGRVAGIFRPTPADVGRWAAVGFTFFLIGNDTMILSAALAEGLAAARKA